MTEDELWNLSDEELEKEVNRVKSEDNSNESNEEVSSKSIEEPNNSTEVIEDESDKELEQPTKDSNKDESIDKEVVIPSKYKIKAIGQEFELTLDELKDVASKGFDYTRKMQALAPYRQAVVAMEENGISKDDINLLIDLKKGNKEAIASLLKEKNIDIYDIPSEDEVNYAPTDYTISSNKIALQDTLSKLSSDTVFAQTQQIIQDLDDSSKQFLFTEPRNIELLHEDVKNGVYKDVMPKAQLLAMKDDFRRPVLEYYIQAGSDYWEKRQANEVKAEQEKLIQQEATRVSKQKAGLPKTKVAKGVVADFIDAWDDEQYNAWYKKKIKQQE